MSIAFDIFCGLLNIMKTILLSIIIFCGLQSSIFADDGFSPAIPRFKGCCAKRVATADTNKGVRCQVSVQRTKYHPGIRGALTRVQSTKDKIISLSPAIAEIIYALGAGNKIVAVSDFCTYPPEVRSKPTVGGFVNPSYEKILSLKPNLIIFQGDFAKIKKFCQTYKIPECNVQLDDWNSITNSIQQIGNKIGNSKQAIKLRAEMVSQLNNIRKNSKNKKPIPILVCVGREAGPVASCTTIGKKSFINEMLKIAGGSNICEDVVGAYPTISSEIIYSRQPAVIFDLRPAQKVNEEQIIKEWEFVDKKSRIFVLTNNYLMVPGPRITKIAEDFREKLK